MGRNELNLIHHIFVCMIYINTYLHLYVYIYTHIHIFATTVHRLALQYFGFIVYLSIYPDTSPQYCFYYSAG